MVLKVPYIAPRICITTALITAYCYLAFTGFLAYVVLKYPMLSEASFNWFYSCFVLFIYRSVVGEVLLDLRREAETVNGVRAF